MSQMIYFKNLKTGDLIKDRDGVTHEVICKMPAGVLVESIITNKRSIFSFCRFRQKIISTTRKKNINKVTKS